MDERQAEVTRMLQSGLEQPGEREKLLQAVYQELRGIADRRMGGERSDHTLQATALVHEAWMRLAGDTRMEWRGRGHFYAAAAEAMRRVLVDHARRAKADKRGGNRLRVTLGAAETGDAELDGDRILALSDALDRLEAEDERAAAVTRLRFFSGLSVEETARTLEVSERTVHREWTYARARLFELIEES